MDDPAPGRRDAPADRAAAAAREQAYWRRNVTYVLALLAVWFVVSYGAGILFVQPLDAFRIPGTGFPVGFWFAQQGSIYVFVLLIFAYVFLMNRLDREFGVDETETPPDVDDGASGAAADGGAA